MLPSIVKPVLGMEMETVIELLLDKQEGYTMAQITVRTLTPYPQTSVMTLTVASQVFTQISNATNTQKLDFTCGKPDTVDYAHDHNIMTSWHEKLAVPSGQKTISQRQ
jgi:hypothetical protein